jgi:hypothetical protein
MLIKPHEREQLDSIFKTLKLKSDRNEISIDKTCKIEQIISYLEIIHAEIRHYSKKREIVLVDSGAGNCYLSFLVYYYYTHIDCRNISIHCVDINTKLMEKCRQLAKDLEFTGMVFHATDINDLDLPGKVEMVYALHACDMATDKTLYFGVKHEAAAIISVSCCQHDVKKQLRNNRYSGITKHSVYKDRFVYMVADSLRGLLLEMSGYKVSIFDYVSTRYTDKNIMLRAKKSGTSKISQIREEYEKTKREFQVTPKLELLMGASN